MCLNKKHSCKTKEFSEVPRPVNVKKKIQMSPIFQTQENPLQIYHYAQRSKGILVIFRINHRSLTHFL